MGHSKFPTVRDHTRNSAKSCGSQFHGENNCFVRYPAKKAEFLANKARKNNNPNRQHCQQESAEDSDQAQLEAQHVQFAPAVQVPATVRGRYDLLLAEASENLRQGRSSITNEVLLAMLHSEIAPSSSTSTHSSPPHSIPPDTLLRRVSKEEARP